MDTELDSVLALSPSIFDPTAQLAVRSSGPPSTHSSRSDPKQGVTHDELELYNQGPNRYTPRTPTPVEFDAGEGPLPLEDNSITDHQSTDTQLSSHPPHPRYPWQSYRHALHGAPLTVESMDPDPYCLNYVAFEVDRRYGNPSIYGTLGEGSPAYQFSLTAKPCKGPAPVVQPPDFLLLNKQFAIDPVVNRALEAIGDMGILADVWRYWQIPTRQRAINGRKARTRKLEEFVRNEWADTYREE